MKKLIALLTILVTTLFAGGCTYKNEQLYEQAQLCLGNGEYQSAIYLFSQLGEYEDAADYALYCQALLALHEGDSTLARNTFLAITPFKSAQRYLQYMNAQDAMLAGDLDTALDGFTTLGAFSDSPEQARLVQEHIRIRDLERARAAMSEQDFSTAQSLLSTHLEDEDALDLMDACQDALMQNAYRQASALYEQGSFQEAYDAFVSLGDMLDAPRRAEACRRALYVQAEEDFEQATFETWESLYETYAQMNGYLDAQERMDALTNRFGPKAALISMAQEQPYLLFGAYPLQDGEEPQPVLWQLVSLNGETATLLCQSVLDAAQPGMPLPELVLNDAEKEAFAGLALPDPQELAGLKPNQLQAPATPFARAQGVQTDENGFAWWWLDPTFSGGLQALVWTDGVIHLTAPENENASGGIRPMLRLSLTQLQLSSGSGTQEDPFI